MRIFECSGCSRPKANDEHLPKFDTGSVRGSLLCAPSPHLLEVATTLVRHRTRSGVSLSGELFQTTLNRRCVTPDLRIKNGSRRVRRLASAGGDRHGKNKSRPVLLILPRFFGEEGGVLPPSVFSDPIAFMTLSSELLHSASTSESGSGFNWCQLKLLGVSWPPHHGWLRRLVGVEVSEKTWELIMRLRYARSKPERQVVLARYGLNISTLSQRPDDGPMRI